LRCVIILTVILVLIGIPSVISATGMEKDMSIKLKTASFDPLLTNGYRISGTGITSYPPSGTGAYIVQFNGPVKEGWKRQLEDFGTVHGYVPEYAFIIEMNGSAARDIEKLDFVRWVGTYQPSYKMSPDLRQPTDDFVFIDVLLFDNDYGEVVSKVEGLGGIAASPSPGMIFASVNRSLIPQIAGLNNVKWIEKHTFFKTYNGVASRIMNASVISTTYGMNGSGQIVAVADTGLDVGEDNASMHNDFKGRIENITSWQIDSYFDQYIDNPGADDGAADVDSGHGTHVAGSVLGDGNRSGGMIKGTAYGAGLMFQAVEQYVNWKPEYESRYPDGYYLFGIPFNLTPLFQEAYDNGARIHTNSWGAAVYGEYDGDASTTDAFVWNNKDMVILLAAGNEGIDNNSDGVVDSDSIGSPGTAKNVITVGASENFRPTFSSPYGVNWPSDFPTNPLYSDKMADNPDGMVAFSSRGPTNDGRIKPDVVAPGTYILSTRSSVAPAGGLWGDFDAYYRYSGGTSMSTPLTAGAVALIRQYYVENISHVPNASLIKATLINGAYDMPGQYSPDETGTTPNFNEGWGRVDLKESLFPESPTSLEFSDSEYALSTGENHTYSYEIKDTSVQLKMTLVWTDYPGDPASSVALVNDLDLVVVSPSGTEYHGNDFSGPYNDTRDDRNNVEQVRVDTPEAGNYTVIVKAVNVPQGPQDFSFVVSGGFQDVTPPTSNSPVDATYEANSTGNVINWTLQDTIGPGYYQMLRNGIVTVNWTAWTNNTNLSVPIDTNIGLGQFNYTIYYNDSAGNPGTPDQVWITINDSGIPSVENLFVSPNLVPVNDTVNITADVTDTVGIETVLVNITNGTWSKNYPMQNTTNDTWSYGFNETYSPGTYTATIIANDTSGNVPNR